MLSVCEIVQKDSHSKFTILLKCIKVVKNWYIIPLVYYGLVKSQFVILKLKDGMKIKLRTDSTDLQAFVNVWIIQEYQKDGFEIQNDDVIIDIGGHIGLFSLYSSQFCKNGKIFSFEPIKENYNLLRDNIEQNNIKNIKTFNVAISNKKEKNRIYLSDDDQAAHSFYGIGKKSIEVETTTLDHVIRSENIIKCDLLKLDCEGAEYEIIDSLTDDILSKIKKICLEYHFLNSKPFLLNDLKNKLKTHYNLEDLPSIDGMGILFAKHV
jgi:FkbM family methyltransferase